MRNGWSMRLKKKRRVQTQMGRRMEIGGRPCSCNGDEIICQWVAPRLVMDLEMADAG